MIRQLSLGAASALVLALASAPVSAQQYDGPVYTGPTEEVIVRPPRYYSEDTPVGVEPKQISLTQEVRSDDLDLRTEEGAHALRVRVRETARHVCARLAREFPVTYTNATSCYREAVDDAMYQADNAIGAARGYSAADE